MKIRQPHLTTTSRRFASSLGVTSFYCAIALVGFVILLPFTLYRMYGRSYLAVQDKTEQMISPTSVEASPLL